MAMDRAFFSRCVCVYVRSLPPTKSTMPTHTLSPPSLFPHIHTHTAANPISIFSRLIKSLFSQQLSSSDTYHDRPWRRSCSWAWLLPRLCLTARSVSICFHYQMLTLGLWLDLPVSGGLVEDDHHARSLEDGVFCHLVAVSVHVTFVYRCQHTFYPCAPLHICHVWRSAWLTGPN